MKRSLKTVLVIGVVVAATLVTATAALAWGPDGARGGPRAGGPEAIAEGLGMSVEDLKAALKDGETVADLAEAKGLDLADVKAATEAAHQTAVRESIEQSVADGDLTRERADWMLRGLEEGFMPGMRGRFPGGRMFGMGGATGGLDASANALNMTVEELELQLWGGRSLADLAERQGVELESVQQAIETARKEAMRQALAQAVEDGRLTQEQADWMIEGQESGYGLRVTPRGRGGFPCEPMGEGGPKGRLAPRGGFRGQAAPEDGAGFRAPSFRAPRFGAAEPA